MTSITNADNATNGGPVIPTGARIVVRVRAGVDTRDQRMKYRDYVGHVRGWNGQILELERDPAANGSRPMQRVSIALEDIVTLKPVPERHLPSGSRSTSSLDR